MLWLMSHDSFYTIWPIIFWGLSTVKNSRPSPVLFAPARTQSFSSKDPDTAWNTTEQGWLMKMIWKSILTLPCEYEKRKYMGPLLAKTIWFDILGNIEPIYRYLYRVKSKMIGLWSKWTDTRRKLGVLLNSNWTVQFHHLGPSSLDPTLYII